MTTQFRLPKWFDMHVHFRQDALLPYTIRDQLKAHCAGVVAMPNTKPPVAKVVASDPSPYNSIESYQNEIAEQGGVDFEHVIVPLYLTQDTTPEMIERGVRSGGLKACKYYPPFGTTHADFGRELAFYKKNGVLAAMQEHGVILCLHGEMHGQSPEAYFSRKSNAEEQFYQTVLPEIVEAFPELKIVCEHLTTKVAVDFVKSASKQVAATITPQHLLFTVGHLLKGLHYHLYCLPLLKFDEDREALRRAVISPSNSKFFAGSDSAPHTQKMTACGCAAGCYTAPIAPQLYAEAFEQSGVKLNSLEGQVSLRRFLCDLGPKFYGLEPSAKTFSLVKEPQTVESTVTPEGDLVPLPLGIQPELFPEGQLNWQVIA